MGASVSTPVSGHSAFLFPGKDIAVVKLFCRKRSPHLANPELSSSDSYHQLESTLKSFNINANEDILTLSDMMWAVIVDYKDEDSVMFCEGKDSPVKPFCKSKTEEDIKYEFGEYSQSWYLYHLGETMISKEDLRIVCDLAARESLVTDHQSFALCLCQKLNIDFSKVFGVRIGETLTPTMSISSW